MEGEEAEDTLSISFVDGITCGLAAALLLFIIFGINISVANSELTEAVGEGSISKIRVDLRKSEPTDVVVRVLGPTSRQNSGRWTSGDDANTDHSVIDDGADVTTFIRELPEGLLGGSPAGDADKPLQFSLNWTTIPTGYIDLFRSGVAIEYRFDCGRASRTYEIVRHFDLNSGEIQGGNCTVQRQQ